MDNFVVSARKYRPSRFGNVVGQEHITATLKNALTQNQLAHAFLFTGPRGVGKTTTARILAKVINCENLKDGEACNDCNSCKSFSTSSSFNIFELDAASNNSVDDIRELIQQVRIPPQGARYKVYIIDEVHMLSSQAFNAFLKTLEEPPAYAIFILATTEKHKILPTILSRCQTFDFKRITVAQMVQQLKDIAVDLNVTFEVEALHQIAYKADGGMRDALSLFDKMCSFCNGHITLDAVLEQLNILDANSYFQFTEYMLSADVMGSLTLLHQITQLGFEGDLIMSGMAGHLRNLLICKTPQSVGLLEVSEQMLEQYKKHGALVPSAFILSALNILAESDSNYRMSKNKRLHTEMAFIKLSYLMPALQQSAGGNQVQLPADTVKKKLNY